MANRLSLLEQQVMLQVFSSTPLCEIPLLDLRIALRMYQVSFARDMHTVDTRLPALAELALQEMHRRLNGR